jgi:hypothetical protein
MTMKRLFLILAFALTAFELFPQTLRKPVYNNGITLNLEALLVRDIKLTFSHRLNEQSYMEILLSYSFSYFHQPGLWGSNSFWSFRDPFFDYGRVQARIGWKHYFKGRFYLAPDLLYSYGQFDKKDIWYDRGSSYHYIVTRDKNEIEIFAKAGWTFQKGHFLHDFYLGYGYRIRFLSDDVYEDLWEDTNSSRPHPPNPYHVNTSYGVFTVHVGYQLGYCY